jgi:hypothetical protein
MEHPRGGCDPEVVQSLDRQIHAGYFGIPI